VQLAEKLSNDLKTALKSGDKIRLGILRMIKSDIKNKEIEKGASPGEEEILAMLRSFVKRAKDSIEQFTNAGRTDLAEKEKAELAVIQEYLPKQISEDDIRQIVKDAVEETGASGPKDMGMVMKAVMGKTKGQADGKLVNGLVKEILEK
jgi:uncharacterized protein YqeY